MIPDLDPRLQGQFAFLLELDRLKGVLRQTRLADGSRRENSAEHSWHLAVSALLLAEHAPASTDLLRVLKMVLIHDVVEIDAGDTFCYDVQGNLDREAREQCAADRLFGMLPAEQGAELRALWEEFEAGATADARFAVALDRLQPLLLNYSVGGGTWREHAVTHDRVLARMDPVRNGAPEVWPFVVRVLEDAVARGYLPPAPG